MTRCATQEGRSRTLSMLVPLDTGRAPRLRNGSAPRQALKTGVDWDEVPLQAIHREERLLIASLSDMAREPPQTPRDGRGFLGGQGFGQTASEVQIKRQVQRVYPDQNSHALV